MERITLWLTLLYSRVQSWKDEEGQALVEYALILSLVMLVVFATLKLVGTNLNTIINTVAQDL